MIICLCFWVKLVPVKPIHQWNWNSYAWLNCSFPFQIYTCNRAVMFYSAGFVDVHGSVVMMLRMWSFIITYLNLIFSLYMKHMVWVGWFLSLLNEHMPEEHGGLVCFHIKDKRRGIGECHSWSSKICYLTKSLILLHFRRFYFWSNWGTAILPWTKRQCDRLSFPSSSLHSNWCWGDHESSIWIFQGLQ